MSFPSPSPKARPERVKPPANPSSPIPDTPLPPSWSTSRARRTSNSSTASTSSQPDQFHDARYDAATESEMLTTSNTIKTEGNTQFSAGDYSSAISTYDRAMSECPNYLDYELALLQSNIAACHIKLEQYKEALESCERALEGLERELPMPKKPGEAKKTRPARSKARFGTDDDDARETTEDNTLPDSKVVELDPSLDETLALHTLSLSDARKSDIHRIRTKTLLRRARARSSLVPSTWSSLSGALEDYTLLSSPEYFSTLPVADQKTVREGLRVLPPRVNEMKEKEMADMMGKLKELGNGILKPFGLSTENFKFTQDPKTGGYSMNFEQGGGEGK